MSTLKAAITKDLLAGASTAKRNFVTFAVLAVGVVAAISTSLVPTGVLQAVTIPTALIAIAVALRISGPQDAKSFRLYRKPSAA